jgi:hypothetical protein
MIPSWKSLSAIDEKSKVLIRLSLLKSRSCFPAGTGLVALKLESIIDKSVRLTTQSPLPSPFRVAQFGEAEAPALGEGDASGAIDGDGFDEFGRHSPKTVHVPGSVLVQAPSVI